MGRVFHICSEAGDALLCTIAGADDSPILTNMGPKPASTLNGSTKASFTFPGVDSDGDVEVFAFFGGAPGNQHQVSIGPGPTGVGNEDLPLRLEVSGSAPAWEVAVLYATDGSGASVTPTGLEVASLLGSDPAVENMLEASLPGSGASDVVSAALTPLAGGEDDGDWIKFEGTVPVCRQINRAGVV